MSDNSDYAIAILLLYGNVRDYGDNTIAFTVPGTTDKWLKLDACSIHNVVKGQMLDVIGYIDNGQ